MSYLKTPRGVDIFYKSEGSGQAVIFLHGFAADSSIWHSQISRFSTEFLTVAIDLPGHGNSGWQESRLEDISDDIYFLITELKIKSCFLVAHSFSGLLALDLARRYPELIRGLVLVTSTPRFVALPDFNTGIPADDLERLKEFVRVSYPAIIPVFLRTLFSEEERQNEGFNLIWEGLCPKNKEFAAKQVLLNFLEIIRFADLRDFLDNISSPCLMINGENDPIIGDRPGIFLKEKIPNSRLEIFKGCGHFPFLTHEQSFFALVRDFFSHNGTQGFMPDKEISRENNG